MAIQWKDLDGEERYRIVEMARKREVPITEICETFGLSRQTLYRAMDKADEAAVAALEKQTPGRKPSSEEVQQIAELKKKATALQAELDQYKVRYEVAQAFLDLERQYDRGELNEDGTPKNTAGAGKKTRRTRRRKRAGRRSKK